MSTKDMPELTFKEFYQLCKITRVSLPSFVFRYIAQLERKIREMHPTPSIDAVNQEDHP